MRACVCVCVCVSDVSLSLSLSYIHMCEWDLLEGAISSCTIFSINSIRHVGKVSHGCLQNWLRSTHASKFVQSLKVLECF